VNSTPTPKETDAQKAADTQVGRPDERLAHAYEEIKRADEQLTQMSERLAKIEGDTPRPAPAAPAPQSQPAPVAEPPPVQVSPEHVAPSQVSPAKPASRSPMALLMAAGFVVTALVLSAYGGGIVTRWAPQLGSARSSPPEGPTLAAQSAPSLVQVASAETVPLPATPKATSQEATSQATPSQPTPPRATSLAQAQTTPPDAAPPVAAPPAVPPPAAAAPADQAQLLQKIARDLAALERNIEALKANQQQMATDNSKAIGELKASQEEMKRSFAKAPEQPLPPRVSPPAKPPVSVVRRPERTYQPPPVRARPRYYPRGEWYYDDW
jgi:hypothetical protein